MDTAHSLDGTLERLQRLADPAWQTGMARFGIVTEAALGISVPALRTVAKELGIDHGLAQQLWATGIHEARILAGMIGDPRSVSEEEMERWALDIDSWDVCDGICGLWERTAHAQRKIVEWSKREEEFVKRAAFVLIAYEALHNKGAEDAHFLPYLDVIAKAAGDDRNFVKKAVNWALRQVGKRNLALNQAAIGTALRIQAQETRSARWIAADALRELRSEQVLRRLGDRAAKG